MARSIYDDSNQYRSISDQVSECSSWTIRQKFVLFGQIHFWLKCGLSIGWVIITREHEPPHPPSLLQHSVRTQLQLSSTPNHHVELIQLLRYYSQSRFRYLSPIFFHFCISRGSFELYKVQILWKSGNFVAELPCINCIRIRFEFLIRISTLEVYELLHVVYISWLRWHCF